MIVALSPGQLGMLWERVANKAVPYILWHQSRPRVNSRSPGYCDSRSLGGSLLLGLERPPNWPRFHNNINSQAITQFLFVLTRRLPCQRTVIPIILPFWLLVTVKYTSHQIVHSAINCPKFSAPRYIVFSCHAISTLPKQIHECSRHSEDLLR